MTFKFSFKSFSAGITVAVGQEIVAETAEDARRMANVLLFSHGVDPQDTIRILEWREEVWRGTVCPDA